MAADTLDLITLSESLDAIGRQGDTPTAADQTRLEAFTTAASRWVDHECGPVVARTLTSESYDGGGYVIVLDYAPVSNVQACSEYSNTTETALTSESNTTKSASDFMLDPARGLLWRRSSNTDKQWKSGRRNVIVTYEAGRYANTAAVDRRFKEACKIIVRHLFSLDHGSGGELFGEGVPAGFAVPARALELLAQDRRHPSLTVR